MDLNNNLGGPSLKETTGIECENCGCEVFVPTYILRKISKLLIGAQTDGIIPVNTFSCAKCGHVNKEFIPQELLDTTEEKEGSKTNIII